MSVQKNVAMLKSHPLIPDDVKIEGYVINSETGELLEVTQEEI